MPELLLVENAKRHRGILTVAGVCAESQTFLDYLNEAVRMAARRGDFDGTLITFQACVNESCTVWPNWIGGVRAVNVCRHPIPTKNLWGEFLRFGHGTLGRSGPCNSDFVCEQRGTTPVIKNVPCNVTRYIRAYPRCQADIGKTITFYGVDSNGQDVMTKQSDGTWIAGMTLTLALPFVSTSTQFRRVTRVRKDVTQCPVDVYQYDATNNVLEDMAHYEPAQKNPSYIFSVLSGVNPGCGNCTAKVVDVLAKLAIFDLEGDHDVLPIQNLESIKMLIEAIKMGEAGNLQGKFAMVADAVHELNLGERDKNADDSVPVEVATFGSARLEYKRIGRMV